MKLNKIHIVTPAFNMNTILKLEWYSPYRIYIMIFSFKKALLTAAIFSAFSATATQNTYLETLKKMNFDELAAQYDIAFEGDQIFFKGNVISMFNTCMADQNTIRTKSKVVIETLDDEDFVVTGHNYLYKSVNGLKAMVDGDSVKYINHTIATEKDINIVTNDDDLDFDHLFSKRYKIKKC